MVFNFVGTQYSQYVGIQKCGGSNFVGPENWWQLDIDILVRCYYTIIKLRHSKYLCVFKFECIQNKWVFKSAYKYFWVLKMLELYCHVTKHGQVMFVFTIRTFLKFNHTRLWVFRISWAKNYESRLKLFV